MIVAAMSVCFFWTFSMNLPDPVEALKGTFVPYLPSYGLHTAVGVVGSLILPQNYYVHSAVVLSRDVDRTSPREVRSRPCIIVHHAISYRAVPLRACSVL